MVETMKIAFTLCSNNYLAQAKTLGDSLIKYNPGYKFIIGLIDKLTSEINYTSDIGYEIIPLEDIGINETYLLENLVSLVELISPEIKLEQIEKIETITQ